MTDIPLVSIDDDLPDGLPKINQGIKNSYEALNRSIKSEEKSAIAQEKAMAADELSKNVKEQLNQVVIEGSIDPETKQARVDALGNPHDTLKGRSDSDFLIHANQINVLQQNKRTVLDNYVGTKMIAHKGAMNLAPENTIPAFELAGKYGFEFIELDVSVTLDGVLIINHDATIDAMTNGNGTIANMTYEQIQRFNVDMGPNINIYEGTKLCTLEDVLKITVKYNLVPFVELKNINDQNRDCMNVYNMLKKYGLTKKSVIVSYNKAWLEFIRDIDKDIVLGIILNPWSIENVDYIKSLGNAFLMCDRYSATVENVQYCHENGVKIAIYSPTGTGSIDLLSEQREYTMRGVDFILTGSLL
ncbi:hypothetical protein DN392_06350 [Bacillus sp. BB51/4]|uniref:glycerophosphodiester phosphodiesterase n=1 Tax=Bacillus sp. BB51/4 TaxID=2217819 RepID=UPI0011EDEA86|nr:glycerophosphodiester phosphodiesterase family protein [Bacillus sp. BB51/4]KAA0777617.1 hypothetical protein DN392_06350 [Bacillus sp. BB51/4]